MKLYIDTTSSEVINLKLGTKFYKFSSKKEKSQMLLPVIAETLNKNNLSPKDITGIEVNTGPGSYTGIRIGVSVACALGWSLGIPVNGKLLKDGKMPDIKY